MKHSISRSRRTAADQALDANALELFALIALAGSFARAARELGLTRAAVSRRVAAIEAAVGLALFARSTRSLSLTEAGRRLHARARAVLEAAEGARLALRSERDMLSGTLRISAAPVFGVHVLAPLLARFQTLHPALRYELMFTYRRVDLLREGVDIAFRATARPPEDWVAQPLLRYAVRAYGAAGSTPLEGPQALLDRPCLLVGQHEEPSAGNWVHASGERVELSMQASAWGNDLDALLVMAKHGQGVVLSPDFCVPPEAGLVDLLPGWRLDVQEGEWIQALTLGAPAGSETARALLYFLREHLAPLV
ncbi:LysR family transcriptional regulator [Paucibacter sp. B2R-40]|uniref:LysR family transcriptional regulator n=1 Tax=Paucibacter sp. B2R-40 TaxID=2893554 RepID=UPI0021E449E3|nr:LysR family transcriptional regulator [Paucibacter sp. B2R-40]MCV2352982.1 LysR family transcriptional regulator [Paucibacter sp. B2R-40]